MTVITYGGCVKYSEFFSLGIGRVHIQTVVFDVGAAYGVHPSWNRAFKAKLLNYHAFEPNNQAANLLFQRYQENKDYILRTVAISSKNDSNNKLKILEHEGLSTLLEPNPSSEWFTQGLGREHDGDVKESRIVKTITLDSYIRKYRVIPHFLKIDAEGLEYQILQGAKKNLHHLLGIRLEVSFEEVFIGGNSFYKVGDYLTRQNFKLANLDYRGQGLAKSYFCPNKEKYGIVSSTDAVFIRCDYNQLDMQNTLRMILFCFENSLEDLALHLLHSETLKSLDQNLRITKFIKLRFLEGANSLRYFPSEGFLRAKEDFTRLFREKFPDKAEFWQSYESLKESLFGDEL